MPITGNILVLADSNIFVCIVHNLGPDEIFRVGTANKPDV